MIDLLRFVVIRSSNLFIKWKLSFVCWLEVLKYFIFSIDLTMIFPQYMLISLGLHW